MYIPPKRNFFVGSSRRLRLLERNVMLHVTCANPRSPSILLILTPAAGPVFVTLLLQNSVAIRDGQPTMQDEMRPRGGESGSGTGQLTTTAGNTLLCFLSLLLLLLLARLLLLLHPPLHRASADAAIVQLHWWMWRSRSYIYPCRATPPITAEFD